MLLSCEIPGPQWAALRAQIQMYGMASIELLMKDARGIENLDSLKRKQILYDDEIEFLHNVPISQRPIVMWSWILKAWFEAMKIEGSPAPHFGAIQRECVAARIGVQTIHTYL